MKIKIIIITCFVAMLYLSSCQKELSPLDTEIITDTVSNRVKTYTEEVTSSVLGNSVTTYNLSYDARGRLISFISAASPGDKLLYQYNSNNSFTMDLYNTNILVIHVDYFLNSFSFVDSTFQYNDTKDSSAEKYLYNSQQQLVQIKDYQYSTATGSQLINTLNYVYDNSGNAIKETDNYSEKTFEYYPDLLNTLNTGLIYFKNNTNLTKTTTYNFGGNTQTVNHAYTFDASNRLSTEKVTASNGEVVTRIYTY